MRGQRFLPFIILTLSLSSAYDNLIESQSDDAELLHIENTGTYQKNAITAYTNGATGIYSAAVNPYDYESGNPTAIFGNASGGAYCVNTGLGIETDGGDYSSNYGVYSQIFSTSTAYNYGLYSFADQVDGSYAEKWLGLFEQ